MVLPIWVDEHGNKRPVRPCPMCGRDAPVSGSGWNAPPARVAALLDGQLRELVRPRAGVSAPSGPRGRLQSYPGARRRVAEAGERHLAMMSATLSDRRLLLPRPRRLDTLRHRDRRDDRRVGATKWCCGTGQRGLPRGYGSADHDHVESLLHAQGVADIDESTRNGGRLRRTARPIMGKELPQDKQRERGDRSLDDFTPRGQKTLPVGRPALSPPPLLSHV